MVRPPGRGRPRSIPPDFDAAGYAAAYPDIAAVLGGDPAKLHRHWAEWGHLENRTPFGLAPYRERRFGRGFWDRAASVTMVGFFEAQSGIGAAARAYRAALVAAGYEVAAVTVVEDGPRLETMPDLRPRPAGLLRRPRLPPAARRSRVSLFALNADTVHRFMLDGRTALLDDSYTIGIWFWELAHFPAGWQAAFGAFDEIWVASEFCRAALAAVSPVPVVTVPMPVLPPAEDAPLLPRRHFGLPDDVFLFGCTFDVGSLVRRKNPLAAVEAFLAGFRGRRDAMLVLKYHGTRHYPESIAPVVAAAAGHANIRLIDRTFDAHEAASFRAALDVLVSPHRSEGFGLNLAEAMLAERMVVATAYSGNTDFMDAADSVPVGYRLAEVGEGAWPYPASALWAEPDADELAAALQRAFAEREAGRSLAGRARARIASGHGVESAAASLRERLDPVLHRRREAGPPPGWGASRHAATRRVTGDGPRLAVIAAPTLLSPERLPLLVTAMEAQSHADWELLLADEPGCPEAARSAMRALRGRDPRIKVCLDQWDLRTDDVLSVLSARHVVLLDDAEPGPSFLAGIVAALVEDPLPRGHAEERPQAASRSTHERGASFETPAPRAPQDDAVGSSRPGSGEPYDIVSRARLLAGGREPYGFAALRRLAGGLT